MKSDRKNNILEYVARDLEAAVLPQVAAPQIRFLVGAMSSLLRELASERPEIDVAAAGGLRAALDAAIAARPGSEGARDAAYRQSGSGSRDGAGAAEGPLGPITAAMLEPYLRLSARYGAVSDVEVAQTPGGFSKETFLVSFRANGEPQRLVLRRDPAFSPLGSVVTEEYPLLRALDGAGLRTPQMLWVEADPVHFGAPVIAMSRVEGSADVSKWTGDPVLAREIVDQAADLLARLHAPATLELHRPRAVIPGADGVTPLEMVTDMRRWWTRMAQHAPLVDTVFDWLEANAPAAFVRKALLHGDFGFHNLLIDKGRIAGLLDWEFSHVGDVAEDLAYARPFIEQVLPWEEFEALYRAHGGPQVDPASVHFWGVFGVLRIGLGCYATLGEIDRHNPRLDAKASYVAVSFAEPFVIDAAKLALKGP